MINKGFTLIEILVVLVVMGIVSGIVLSLLNPVGFLKMSRDSRRKSDLSNTQAAIELYYSQKNVYPDSGTVPFGSQWESEGVIYLKSVPQDLLASQTYCYTTTATGYYLCAKMEDVANASNGQTCNEESYNYCLENPY